jgi:hypothetical protein
MTDGALAQHAAPAGRILLEACKLHQKAGAKSAPQSHQSELDHSVSIGRGGALSSLVVSSSATLGTPQWRRDCKGPTGAATVRNSRKETCAGHDSLAESVGISSLSCSRRTLIGSEDALHRRGCWRLGSTPLALHIRPAANIRTLPTAAHLLQTPVKMPVPHLQQKSVWSTLLTRREPVWCLSCAVSEYAVAG